MRNSFGKDVRSQKYMFIGGSSPIGSIVKTHFISKLTNITILNGTRTPVDPNDFYFDFGHEYLIPDGPGVAYLFSFSKLNNLLVDDIAKSYEINILKTFELLDLVNKKNWDIVYISSDAVDNYLSSDLELNHLNLYGHQKFLIEKYIKENFMTCKIIRISKVFDTSSPLQIKWIEQLQMGRKIDVYDNYYFSPITNSFLTSAIANIDKDKNNKFFKVSGKTYLSYSNFFQLLEKYFPDLINFSLINYQNVEEKSKFNFRQIENQNNKSSFQQDVTEVLHRFRLNYKNHKNIYIY